MVHFGEKCEDSFRRRVGGGGRKGGSFAEVQPVCDWENSRTDHGRKTKGVREEEMKDQSNPVIQRFNKKEQKK